MQYVKIRYSIDMEDVPKKIFSLLQELGKVSEDFPKNFKKVVNSTKNLTTSGIEDISSIMDGIEELRHSLYQVDMRLGDCAHMLRGYQRANLGDIVGDIEESEEDTFEPYEEEPDQYNESFREQLKEKITNEVLSDFQNQMKDITHGWQATKNDINEKHQAAISQLPSNIQGMIGAQNAHSHGGGAGMPNMADMANMANMAGMPDNGAAPSTGHADLVRSVMEKMMKEDTSTPPKKKK